MAVILSPRGNEASNMMKRFVRYEEAAQYFGLDETLIIAYAKAAGAVYQLSKIRLMDCQHFFRQIFLGYFSDIVQAFDTLRKNVCGDDYTSLHNPIVLSSVLPAYGMFHSIQILFL